MKKLNSIISLVAFSCLPVLTNAQTGNTKYGEKTVNKGEYNCSFGYYAGRDLNNNSEKNCFFGSNAGRKTTSGKNNVFMGERAGFENKTGSNNTYLGVNAGYELTEGSGNVFIGYKAGYEQHGSNQLVIGNNPNNPLIYGKFDKNFLQINGKLNITNGLYFNSENHSDGLPQARMKQKWGIRFDAPVSKWVFSSKNSVLIGYEPDGTNYGNGSLFVENKVGIGTTTPSTMFEVNMGNRGNQNALARITGEKNPGLEIASTSDQSPRLLLTTNDGADQWEMNVAGNRENRALVFKYNGNNHLSISKNGYVGIGTTTPAYKLEVNGTVKASQFISAEASFPDYVFEEGYHIMPLTDLESFVDEHKHLPNMPSEKEVVENGMDISEVTIKSVENIETIYLHLIELTKKLDYYNNKVELLERENAALRKATKNNAN